MSKRPKHGDGSCRVFAGRPGSLRDLPIWTKLGLIMIVPTIATIVVGTAGLLDQVEQASDAERARSLTVLSGEAGDARDTACRTSARPRSNCCPHPPLPWTRARPPTAHSRPRLEAVEGAVTC